MVRNGGNIHKRKSCLFLRYPVFTLQFIWPLPNLPKHLGYVRKKALLDIRCKYYMIWTNSSRSYLNSNAMSFQDISLWILFESHFWAAKGVITLIKIFTDNFVNMGLSFLLFLKIRISIFKQTQFGILRKGVMQTEWTFFFDGWKIFQL